MADRPKTAPDSPKKTEEEASKRKPSRLGRGLSSLMSRPVQISPREMELVANSQTPSSSTETTPKDSSTNTPTRTAESGQPGITYLPLSIISPNPGQPRRQIDEAALVQLADSIRTAGLMQPIIVRPMPGSGGGIDAKYQIVAGERRWRAAGLAKLNAVPTIIHDLDDRKVAQWALIENLQREDLNPIDRAEAFRNLNEQFGLSHDQIAAQVGVDRSSVSNLLRLLNLNLSVQELVRNNLLSMGQARALISLTNTKLQIALAKQAVREGWSVRRTEQSARLAANRSQTDVSSVPIKAFSPRAAHVKDLEQKIAQQLQTKVRIKPGRKKGAGSMTIEFYSLDQFDSLLTKLGVTTD